jgi:threonine aldolase
VTFRANFASDNQAPAHPRVIEALIAANAGTAPSYGADEYTERAAAILRDHFGTQAIPFLVLTGTGANVLALGSGLRSWEGVICADSAHISDSETGAPEWHLGTQLFRIPREDGKLRPEDLRGPLRFKGSPHASQPRVVSIAQVTEYGMIYRQDELRALTQAAHAAGLIVHMDGARLANAAAALGTSLAAVSSECGVDVLSLGATKSGALGAEAVICFRPELAEGFLQRRKQAMQLASKMRYVAAQMIALFESDLWRSNARHANEMALRLATGLASLPGVRLSPPEANLIFAQLPREHVAALMKVAAFYPQREERSEYRFVCSFATTAEEVDSFLAMAHSILT